MNVDLVTSCQVGPHGGCHSQGAPESSGPASWLGWLETINVYANAIQTHWPRWVRSIGHTIYVIDVHKCLWILWFP